MLPRLAYRETLSMGVSRGIRAVASVSSTAMMISWDISAQC